MRHLRPRRTLRLAGAGALCLLLTAPALRADCEEVEAGKESAVRGALTSGGSYFVEWVPQSDPIPFNEVFSIEFRVLDPEDRTTLIANAVLTADARMPEHNHGMNLEPHIEVHGDGTATGQGFLLHMEGLWELGVGVAVSGRMERAAFEIDLQP